VAGSLPGEDPGFETGSTIYAVRSDWRGLSWQLRAGDVEDLPPGTILRLADGGAQAEVLRVRPRLRTFEEPLNIEPRPAWTAQTELPLSDLAQAEGRIVYALQNDDTGMIAIVNPDGGGRRVLTSSLGTNFCPRWSPDGRQVAFVSDRLHRNLGESPAHPNYPNGGEGDDMFVLTVDTAYASIGILPSPGDEAIMRVSRSNVVGARSSNYGCPVWSPDGQYIAAVVDMGAEFYLAVMDATGADVPSLYARLGTPSGGPYWTPDSSRVVLAHRVQGESTPQVAAFDMPEQPGGPMRRNVIRAPGSWRSISGMALSPDGWQVMLLSAPAGTRDSRSLAVLRQVNLTGISDRAGIPLGHDYTRFPTASGALAWLPDDSLGVILRGRPDDRYKATIQRYDLARRALEPLATVEDVLYDAAWSPDGRWLLYSTESGLWGLDVLLARQGRAAPVWLSPEPIYDIDWR
jgi:Tol biopolymer transport system component